MNKIKRLSTAVLLSSVLVNTHINILAMDQENIINNYENLKKELNNISNKKEELSDFKKEFINKVTELVNGSLLSIDKYGENWDDEKGIKEIEKLISDKTISNEKSISDYAKLDADKKKTILKYLEFYFTQVAGDNKEYDPYNYHDVMKYLHCLDMSKVVSEYLEKIYKQDYPEDELLWVINDLLGLPSGALHIGPSGVGHYWTLSYLDANELKKELESSKDKGTYLVDVDDAMSLLDYVEKHYNQYENLNAPPLGMVKYEGCKVVETYMGFGDSIITNYKNVTSKIEENEEKQYSAWIPSDESEEIEEIDDEDKINDNIEQVTKFNGKKLNEEQQKFFCDLTKLVYDLMSKATNDTSQGKCVMRLLKGGTLKGKNILQYKEFLDKNQSENLMRFLSDALEKIEDKLSAASVLHLEKRLETIKEGCKEIENTLEKINFKEYPYKLRDSDDSDYKLKWEHDRDQDNVLRAGDAKSKWGKVQEEIWNLVKVLDNFEKTLSDKVTKDIMCNIGEGLKIFKKALKQLKETTTEEALVKAKDSFSSVLKSVDSIEQILISLDQQIRKSERFKQVVPQLEENLANPEGYLQFTRSMRQIDLSPKFEKAKRSVFPPFPERYKDKKYCHRVDGLLAWILHDILEDEEEEKGQLELSIKELIDMEGDKITAWVLGYISAENYLRKIPKAGSGDPLITWRPNVSKNKTNTFEDTLDLLGYMKVKEGSSNLRWTKIVHEDSKSADAFATL